MLVTSDDGECVCELTEEGIPVSQVNCKCERAKYKQGREGQLGKKCKRRKIEKKDWKWFTEVEGSEG